MLRNNQNTIKKTKSYERCFPISYFASQLLLHQNITVAFNSFMSEISII